MTPFLLGKHLNEGIEPLVHPAPLPLVGVNDHGEPIVAHFVNDDGDEAVLRAFRVGPVFFRAWTVETDHGVFHAINGAIDGNGDRVRIIESVFGIEVEGVDDGVSGVGAPKWFRLVGIVGHGPDGLLAGGELVLNGVPDELARG